MPNVLMHRFNGTIWEELYPTPGPHTHNASDINAGTLDANRIPATLNDSSSRRFSLNANGVPTSNLGSPSIAEMALFQEQFNNKTEFYNITKIKFYTSPDNINWTEITTFTDANKKILVGGDATTNGITIPNNTAFFRIEIENAGDYVYLNALYFYWQSSGHSSQVRVWSKPRNTQVWGLVTNSSASVSAWPGHLFLPFPTIPFHPSGTSHADAIRIEFQNTWNLNSGTNPSGWNLPIYLHKMQIWGGYPAGKRTIYSVDMDRNVNFPAEIREIGQRVYSPNNKPNWVDIQSKPALEPERTPATFTEVQIGAEETIKSFNPKRVKEATGYRSISQGSSKTLAIGDAYQMLLCTAGTGTTTITIPTNASVSFNMDTEITICRYGAGEVEISPASGVTIVSHGGNRKINEQYQVVTLKKVNTNVWLLVGALKS